MAEQRHPIAHHWIKQTLVPFLHYAFVSTLPQPADISEQIQQSIDFCLEYPFHTSDGDDLVFERIFMAVMHRHRKLAPDLEVIIDNLEPLAKFLIRRAQLKGPYDLLGSSDVGSGAWVENEQHRLGNLVVKALDTKEELLRPTQPTPVPAKQPPSDRYLDPRLIHAKQGQVTIVHFPEQLSTYEDAYYRRQNCALATNCSDIQQHSISSSSKTQSHGQHSDPSYRFGTSHAARESPYRHERQDYAQRRQTPSVGRRPFGLQHNEQTHPSELIGSTAIHQTSSTTQALTSQPQLGLYAAPQDRQSRQQMPYPAVPPQRLPTTSFTLDRQQSPFLANAAKVTAAQGTSAVAEKVPLSRSVQNQPAQISDLTAQSWSALPSERYASGAKTTIEASFLRAPTPIEHFTAETMRRVDSVQHRVRARLPSLDQMRNRYNPSQQRAHTVAPAIPAAEAFSWTQDKEKNPLTQDQDGRYYLRQSSGAGVIITSNPQADVLQQLRGAAG